jgi:cell division protein FtsQ
MNSRTIEHTLKRLAWIAGLFVVAALVISAVEYKRTSFVRNVVIAIESLEDGSYMIKEEDVLLLLQRSFGSELQGQSLALIDVDRLERVLESDPFVRDADAFVDAENVIHLNVRQRQPVLRVIDQQGVSYYLDASGHRMPTSQHFTARVLVATGNINPFDPGFRSREKDSVRHVFELTGQLLDDPFYRALIEQIHVDENKVIHLTPKIGKQKIVFGPFRDKDVEKRLQRLKVFYKEGMPYSGWEKYKSIDVQYEGQVVCKK